MIPVVKSWEHLICLLRGYHIHRSDDWPGGPRCATCSELIDGEASN